MEYEKTRKFEKKFETYIKCFKQHINIVLNATIIGKKIEFLKKYFFSGRHTHKINNYIIDFIKIKLIL